MNESIGNNAWPSDIQVVAPKQDSVKIIAMSDPVYNSDSTDKKYDERIAKHIERINAQEQVLARDKTSLAGEIQQKIKAGEPVEYNGKGVLSLFHNLSNRRAQETINLFQTFTKSGDYYVLDIETFGDSQDRERPFGINEISINKYDSEGNLVKAGYNGVIGQSQDVISELNEALNKIESDRYSYNAMPEWKKRSLVDLMRFSSYKEESDKNAFTVGKEVRHHSIIDSVFNHKDQVDHGKVVREMDMYLKYMRSGLDEMATSGKGKHSGEKAMKKVASIMEKNPDAFVVTYNGNSFDMPVLEAFGKKVGVELPSNVKHLDYLNVIKTAFMDSDDLKRRINPDYTVSDYGKDKLSAYVKDLLNITDGGEHNAKVDVDNTAKVVAATVRHIESELNSSQKPLKDGFNYYPTSMTWNSDDQLKNGQKLFSTGGINAFRESDESFRMALDEDGKWVPKSSGFNKTVINSKSFYEFAGHVVGQEVGEGNQAFRFYDRERNEYSYIVKSGDKAFEELTDFVQQRFYQWNNVDPQRKREILHATESDRARRRYDRYFSMDGAGKGVSFEDGKVVERGTMGFAGLKRMLKNAEKMEVHLDSNKEVKRRVKELMDAGMTRTEAKAEIRKIHSHELIEQLDFNSSWDPEKKAYVFNQSEKDQFFKMYGRLVDERPVLEKAVQAIESQYAAPLQKATEIEDHQKRSAALKKVNQKRDQALMRYQQQLVGEIGSPTEKVELQPYDTHRINYFDPEAQDYRSLNFETVETAQKSIYGYGKKGVGEGPGRGNAIRERVGNLMNNLLSQGVIEDSQHDHYMKSLYGANGPWQATHEIALDMRNKSGGHYETHREQPVINSNKAIKKVAPEINQRFIEQAIRDTENSQMFIRLGAIDGKKIELGEEIRKSLSILDEEHFSKLNPNNYQAVEELLTSVRKNAGGRSIALGLDEANANMKVYVYDSANSVSVVNQLQRGAKPGNALEMNLPLISRSGKQRVGNRVINAHSMAAYEDGEVKVISSAQNVARGYSSKMNRIMKAVKDGDYDKANTLAQRTLNEEVKSMAGIQRNMVGGENDTYKWANTAADTNKQAYVKLGNAMIEDLFYGEGFDGIKLTESDFYDWEDVSYKDSSTGKMKLRRGVSLEDVTGDKSYQMLMKMPKWSEQKLEHLNLYTSSLKAEQVATGTMSMNDIREQKAYGAFYNHGRDNLIQYENAYVLNDNMKAAIPTMPGMDMDPLLSTPKQVAYDNYLAERKQTRPANSFNIETAFMTQDQLRARFDKMMGEESGRSLLQRLDYLDENGNLLAEKLPRLYEQQGIIAKDVIDTLEVDNEKRFTKGSQFKMNPNLELGGQVEPGTWLGDKTHENGYIEKIRYEGNKTATLIGGATGNDDLLLRWTDKPFKIMLDGEKMTDSPAERELIESLTGKKGISAILNPEVVKHEDVGMLMAGEARLMARKVNELSGDSKAKAISIIEGAGIGLKYDGERGGFIDHSLGQDIEPKAFDSAFKKLQAEGIEVSSRTEYGVRYGLLEGRLSKVSNYSKVVDHTGKVVLGHKPNGEKIYGAEGGVQWGHREMSVLGSYSQTEGISLDKTREHVFGVMKEKSKRLSEAVSLKESLRYLAQGADADAVGINASEFQALPETHRSLFTLSNGETGGSFKDTVFDERGVRTIAERLQEKHGIGSAAVNEHGFWMNLPSVERTDGKLNKITVQSGNGKTKEIDKIFIPFTRTDDVNGEVQLRDMQRHIANIYEKAAAVENATDIDEARNAQSQLQGAVTKHMKQSFKELTSSKGMLLGEGFKAGMSTSASGLFKLMDLDTSLKVAEQYGDGQYTMISEAMAKKMGVYDQLANGKELYTASVRYPTFHDGAMQFTKLKMADWIKEDEIHTSSFASSLQNADSDGDMGHLVVIDDEDGHIQKEWKNAHDQTERKFQDKWDSHVAKEGKTHKSVAIDEVTQDIHAKRLEKDPTYVSSGAVPSSVGNSDEQMAAKIGKMTIGRASNLNLFIRQVADGHFKNNHQVNEQLKEFGRGLEQKLIDAKHGAKPAGLDMINAIYEGDWNKATEIDNQYFDQMFQREYHMNTVAKEIPVAVTNMKEGLRTKGMKFGTSSGIDYKYGIENLIDLIQGNADPEAYGGANAGLEMIQKHLREMGEEIGDPSRTETTRAYERVSGPTMRERSGVDGLGNWFRNLAGDTMGGGFSETKSKVSDVWDSMKGMDAKKKGLALGGIAVAGLAGYNVLNTGKPERHYMNQEELPSGQEQVNPRTAPAPALQMPAGGSGTHNASVKVTASGKGVSQQQMSTAVTKGMQDTGMNAGPTRVSVTTTDNTQQLNRNWYRDKVRENV